MTSQAFELARLGNAYSDGALSNRNLIINGAMQINQRYGYNSPQTDWNSYSASDRFFKRTSGSATSTVQTRNDDAPDGFVFSDKFTVSLANSDTYLARGTTLEWNNITHLRSGYSDAKTITLSFWVKASIAGVYCFAFTNHAASHSAHDADTSYVTEYTINAANTWEKKIITVTLPTSTPSNWDGSSGANTIGLLLCWSLSGTSSYGTSTTDTWLSGDYRRTSNQTNMGATLNATWQITGVQLEVGDTATPFEYRSYGDELARCQRYYWKGELSSGPTYLTNGGNIPLGNGFLLPVTMRAAPSGTVVSNEHSSNSNSGSLSELSIEGGRYKCNMNVTAGTVSRTDICSMDAEL